MANSGRSANSEVNKNLKDGVSTFHHQSVMVDDVVALVGSLSAGYFLDATIGGGGHSLAILDANPNLNIVGIDQDPVALEAAARLLEGFESRVVFTRNRFDHIEQSMSAAGADSLAGFLFDLGVSSPQLDRSERGFSFRNDGPLDMRMDTDAPLTASEVVNSYDQKRLSILIRANSDEKFASKIAAAIVDARPIVSTAKLAEVIVQAIPAAARRTGGHPAKRTFQAIRIEVNQELAVLGPAVEAALDKLAPGGRGIVITYHSAEDRIVKDIFRSRSTAVEPPGFPVSVDVSDFSIVRPSGKRPSELEQSENRRSSSARLRAVDRRAA